MTSRLAASPQSTIDTRHSTYHEAVPCPLHAAAVASPETSAVLAPDRTLSYGEMERLVAGTAERLRAHGCGEGTRVGLHLPNGWRYLVLLMAVIRAGGVACPLSTRTPPQGLGARLRQVDARLLLTDEKLDQDDATVLQPETAIRPAQPKTEVAPTWPLGRPATVVFTSGSSGTPKAALHALGNHYWSARGSNENIPLAPGDRWLLSLPLYHVGGLAIFFRCLLAGATVVVPSAEALRRHPLAAPGITHASMVSTQLLRLLQEGQGGGRTACPAPDAGSGTLKALLLGGSALPPSLLEAAHARGLPVHTSYGLTEMASQVTTTPPGAARRLLQTSGRPLPYRDVRIASDGEILVRGATLFLGYVEGDAVAPSRDAEGWFHTRDVGAFGEDGCLRVRGRKDNLFISGGENVHPEEVERALERLADVAQAVAVPVPDREFGFRSVAFVRLREGALDADVLRRHLEETLPRFKIPLAFFNWPDDGGASAGMKVDRAAFGRLAQRLLQARS